MTKMTTYRTQRKPGWVILHGLAASIAWGSTNAQLRCWMHLQTTRKMCKHC